MSDPAAARLRLPGASSRTTEIIAPMDLGIAGRKAIVCASSQGLGFACAGALAREGVQVVLNGRNAERLERAHQNLLDLIPRGSGKFRGPRMSGPPLAVRRCWRPVPTPIS